MADHDNSKNALDVIRGTTTLVFPVVLIFAGSQILNASRMPGEGFSAGLLVAVSILLLHIGLGYEAAEHRLPRGLRWALPAGLGLAVATGLWGLLQGRGFLTHAKVTLPFGNEHLSLSTSILFDVAIFLLVGGGAYQIFQILGKEESV